MRKRLCHVDDWEKRKGDQKNPPQKLEVLFEELTSLDKTEQALDESELRKLLDRKERKDAEQKAWRAGCGSSRNSDANRMTWRLGSDGDGHVNLYDEHGNLVSCITERTNDEDLAMWQCSMCKLSVVAWRTVCTGENCTVINPCVVRAHIATQSRCRI